MASSAKHVSLFLLLTLLCSLLRSHAKHTQFFNKDPTSTHNNNNYQQEPNFLPDNENGYGLYGHESGQLPPWATTPAATESEQPPLKYLHKNYNPVAFVTQPEDSTERTTFAQGRGFTANPNNNHYYNGAQNYYDSLQEEDSDINYYNGGSRYGTGFRSQKYFDGAGEAGGLRQQGMSDTRFLENGKYFYDITTDEYSSNHPYERLRGVRARNEYGNRNYHGNVVNEYEFSRGNSMGGYQSQDGAKYNVP